MNRALLSCLMGLLTALTPIVPADARTVTVRMDRPTMVGEHTVRLTGKVRGRDRVVVQRYAEARHRWVRVKDVRANRRGAFATKVRTTVNGRTFRVKAGSSTSRAYHTRSVQEPVTDPQGEPDAELTSADECGTQPVKRDGTYWSCTLAENFDDAELDRTLWTAQTIFTSGSSTGRPCYVDHSSVVEVTGGALHLRVLEVNLPLICPGALPYLPTAHIAGGVMTHRKFSQQYGRFEARIKNTATRVPGLQEAFWLWPDDRYPNGTLWPAAGEIDIAETYSQYPDHAIPFLHYTWNDNGGPIPGVNTAWNCLARRGTFNTYTLEWGPDRIEILVNGRTCLVNTSGDPAFDQRFIIALTQMMGTAGNVYDGRAPIPAGMTVDYVRVWE